LQDPNAAKLSSIRTYLLVAFIFNVLSVIGFLIATLVLIFFIVGVIFIVPLILSIVILRRIMAMRGAAERGDVAKLKSLNSLGWAVIALLLAGIIPGIMLIVANGSINELNASSSPSSPSYSSFAPAGIPPPTVQPPGTSTQVAQDFKFCSSCGAKISRSAVFCPSCGAPQQK
jgi:putative membrane protein